VSLISDALMKAQLETAPRDRVQHRVYMTHGGRTSSSISRTAIVLAAILGGCVTAGIFLFRFTPTASQPAQRGVAVVQQPAAVPAVAKAQPAPASAPAEVRAAEEPRPVAPRKKKIATPLAERVDAPPARASRDSFVSGETYASPVQGPMGSSFTLSGISSSRGDSVAIVNGSLIRAGGAVGPFVVEQIEPRRVRVRYIDVSFWVTY